MPRYQIYSIGGNIEWWFNMDTMRWETVAPQDGLSNLGTFRRSDMKFKGQRDFKEYLNGAIKEAVGGVMFPEDGYVATHIHPRECLYYTTALNSTDCQGLALAEHYIIDHTDKRVYELSTNSFRHMCYLCGVSYSKYAGTKELSVIRRFAFMVNEAMQTMFYDHQTWRLYLAATNHTLAKYPCNSVLQMGTNLRLMPKHIVDGLARTLSHYDTKRDFIKGYGSSDYLVNVYQFGLSSYDIAVSVPTWVPPSQNSNYNAFAQTYPGMEYYWLPTFRFVWSNLFGAKRWVGFGMHAPNVEATWLSRPEYCTTFNVSARNKKPDLQMEDFFRRWLNNSGAGHRELDQWTRRLTERLRHFGVMYSLDNTAMRRLTGGTMFETGRRPVSAMTKEALVKHMTHKALTTGRHKTASTAGHDFASHKIKVLENATELAQRNWSKLAKKAS